MAEFAAIASIIQIADTGFRLGNKLFTFAETVASADQAIISTSKDVSLTASVLKEVGDVLKQDQSFRKYSANAIETATAIVNECSEVFQGMEKVLMEKVPSISSNRKDKSSRTTVALERFKWSYWQPKLQLLRSNLDRLRSTLLVMLNVITYQRLISSASTDVHEGQTALIRDLIESKERQVKKYEKLKRSITDPEASSSKSSKVLDSKSNSTTEATKEYVSPDRKNDNETRSLAELNQEVETSLVYFHHLMSLFDRVVRKVDTSTYQIGLLSRYRIRTHIYKARSGEVNQLKLLHGTEALTSTCQTLGISLNGHQGAPDSSSDIRDRKRRRESHTSPAYQQQLFQRSAVPRGSGSPKNAPDNSKLPSFEETDYLRHWNKDSVAPCTSETIAGYLDQYAPLISRFHCEQQESLRSGFGHHREFPRSELRAGQKVPGPTSYSTLFTFWISDKGLRADILQENIGNFLGFEAHWRPLTINNFEGFEVRATRQFTASQREDLVKLCKQRTAQERRVRKQADCACSLTQVNVSEGSAPRQRDSSYQVYSASQDLEPAAAMRNLPKLQVLCGPVHTPSLKNNLSMTCGDSPVLVHKAISEYSPVGIETGSLTNQSLGPTTSPREAAVDPDQRLAARERQHQNLQQQMQRRSAEGLRHETLDGHFSQTQTDSSPRPQNVPGQRMLSAQQKSMLLAQPQLMMQSMPDSQQHMQQIQRMRQANFNRPSHHDEILRTHQNQMVSNAGTAHSAVEGGSSRNQIVYSETDVSLHPESQAEPLRSELPVILDDKRGIGLAAKRKPSIRRSKKSPVAVQPSTIVNEDQTLPETPLPSSLQPTIWHNHAPDMALRPFDHTDMHVNSSQLYPIENQPYFLGQDPPAPDWYTNIRPEETWRGYELPSQRLYDTQDFPDSEVPGESVHTSTGPQISHNPVMINPMTNVNGLDLSPLCIPPTSQACRSLNTPKCQQCFQQRLQQQRSAWNLASSAASTKKQALSNEPACAPTQPNTNQDVSTATFDVERILDNCDSNPTSEPTKGEDQKSGTQKALEDLLALWTPIPLDA